LASVTRNCKRAITRHPQKCASFSWRPYCRYEKGWTENATTSFVITSRRTIRLRVLCSAISGPYVFAEAREGVNQLFLRDYEHATELGRDRLGPMHMITCHRPATEGQAVRQLGFPNATVVSTPFGVYVADKIQKIQLAFLSNCRDPTSTRY